MIVVRAVELDQQGMLAGDEVTLHHLGYLLEVLYHLVVLVGLRERDTHEGADIETEGLRLHQKAGAGDDAHVLHLLDPLMNGRTGDSALTGYLQKRHPGVLDQKGKDSLVYSVQLVLHYSYFFLDFSIISRHCSRVKVPGSVPFGIL